MPTDADAALLSFIKAEGAWSWLSPGIRTYPGRDENQARIYEACTRLEREGLVVRRELPDDVVVFEPVQKGSA